MNGCLGRVGVRVLCTLVLFGSLSFAARGQDAAEPMEQREEEKRRFRLKVEELHKRAKALRSEGRFREAEKDVEQQVTEMFRTAEHDPELRRAEDLKSRALQARLDGDVDDARMFEGEADRLLENVKQRYHYHPEIDDAVGAIEYKAELALASGDEETYVRLLQEAEQLRETDASRDPR